MDDLNRAVTIDPNFARAWAAKAHLHRYVADYPGEDQTEQYKRSMDALGHALAIDPNLSEAHSALCLNKFRYEYDSAGAESACVRALELDPQSSIGHKAYATFLYSHGRFEESIAEVKRAIDLQPLALENQQAYALALYYARRYEEEEAQWIRLKELNPTHGYIYTRLFINQKQQGKDDKAFDCLIKKLAMDHADNEVIERFRIAYAESGWRGVTIERIKHPENESFTSPFDVACLYATIGDRGMAFEYLEKAYLEHSYRLAVLQVEPQLDPLRSDPRYIDLVKRMGSPQH
jgi:tetratricopeptide (TPR) repeat protein